MSKYDRELDTIVAEEKKAKFAKRRQNQNNRGRANNVIKKAKGGPRNVSRNGQRNGPRNGARNNGPRRNSQPKVVTKTVVVRSAQPRREPVKTGPIKIHVSNLELAVTKLDMQELFQEFGKLGKINMHFNENGRSQGTCDVTFARRADGIRAMKKYDGVPLDGRPMKIKAIGEDLTPAKPQATLATRLGRKPNTMQVRAPPRGQGRGRGGAPSRGRGGRNAPNNRTVGKARQGAPIRQQRGRGGPRGRGRGGRNAGPRKQPEKQLTEEDLDKQLDAYLVKGAL